QSMPVMSVTPQSGTTSSAVSLALGGDSRLFLYLKNLSGLCIFFNLLYIRLGKNVTIFIYWC
ncbi:hypothetical protein, partial [Salmonella enterica]|uniref:hypothetical protein n=1 Tax=Salmonella enterica TaxID=28901 RepID=UPI0032992250